MFEILAEAAVNIPELTAGGILALVVGFLSKSGYDLILHKNRNGSGNGNSNDRTVPEELCAARMETIKTQYGDLKAEFGELKTDVRDGFKDLRTDIANLNVKP